MNFRAFNPFRLPDARELAARELIDAERELLLAQRQRDYSIKMVAFYTTRLQALRASLSEAQQ